MKPKYQEKLIRKLLKTDSSKIALANALHADQELANDTRPRVAVLRPVYYMPEPEAADALHELARYASDKAIIFAPEGIRDASVVHWTRNQLLAKLLKTGAEWTHVLYIDDDIVPAPDALTKMLDHNVDIIGALCTRRQFPPVPTARRFEPDTGVCSPMLDLTGEEGLIEVGAIGTGMILISKHALEQIAEAYFSCLYEKKYMGMSEEVAARIKEERLRFFDESKDAFWFRFLPTLKGMAEYGEDIAFCIVAKEICGIQVYCDTTIQPNHIGRYGFSFKDYLPYQKRMIEKAKKNGWNPVQDLQLDNQEGYEAERHFRSETARQDAGIVITD